jgi:hypothetical protein
MTMLDTAAPEAPTDAPVVVTADGASDTPDLTGLPTRFLACLIEEGLRTTDRRSFRPGAFVWRDLPLTIDAQFADVHGPGAPPPAPIVGSMDNIWREEGTNRILASGWFDLGCEDGREAARKCANKTLRWGSCDYEVLASEYIEIGGGDDLMDMLFGNDGCDDYDWYEEVTSARIGRWTMVTYPAFPGACIVPEGEDLPVVVPMGAAPMVAPGLIASADRATVDLNFPPAGWFENPQLPEPTQLTITPEGRVFGHLAIWDIPHIGMKNAYGGPLYAPHSKTGYADFMVGHREVLTETGERAMLRCGKITMSTGHAASSLHTRAAADHYDNTGTQAANVCIGEDVNGIWIAGALRAEVTPPQRSELLSAGSVSGDWRGPDEHNLEMVAILAVNTAGFLVKSRALVASGAVQTMIGDLALASRPVAGYKEGKMISLVAAGVVHTNPILKAMHRLATELVAQRETIKAQGVIIDALKPMAAERLALRAGAVEA